MGGILDQWATSYRNWRAIFMLVGVGICLVAALVLTRGRGVDDRVEYGLTSGVVTSVKSGSAGHSGSREPLTMHMATIELQDGDSIELNIGFPPVPQVGDTVPLTFEVFDDGAKYYYVDVMEWQLQTGP